MTHDLFTTEQEALQSLMELIEQAKRCQQLHERAHMTLPEPLKRMLGISTNGHKQVASISPPERPPAPREAGSDWVCIEVKNALPMSVALALLREAGSPVVAKEVVAGVIALQPNVPRGTVNNIGTRLDGNAIARSKDGWELLNPESAPILQDGLLWGPASIFGKYELASHRREAILHILDTFKAGMQTGQLIELLDSCQWVHAPVNKDLVQDDVELLYTQGKIRRRGNTKKWEIAKEKSDL